MENISLDLPRDVRKRKGVWSPLQLHWALPLSFLISPLLAAPPWVLYCEVNEVNVWEASTQNCLPVCPTTVDVVIFSLCSSMFSQQSPPHFGQQANTSMYNNNMNINVSMATNTGGMSNMNQMTGQISMTSVTSVPTSGLSSMGPEQVSMLRSSPLSPDHNILSISAFSVSFHVLNICHQLPHLFWWVFSHLPFTCVSAINRNTC